MRLFQLNAIHKDASVSQLQMELHSALGNTFNTTSIHFNCSFMQLKQQTSNQNNIPILE